MYSPALLAFTLNVYRRFLLCLFCVLLMYILKSPNGFLLEMSFFFSCLIIFSVPFERILRLRKKELLNGF